MFSSQFLLQVSLLLLQLWVNISSGICPGDGYSSKIPLYFGYMAAVDPMSSFNSAGTIPAVDLALKLINNNDSLLYGYTLSYDGTVYDSKCDHTVALYEFFKMVESAPPYYIAALAAGCSVSTEPVAELTHFWSFPVVSYAASAPLLSDRTRFPSFFRTYPSDVNSVPAFVALLQSFGWKKVCVITEEVNLFLQNERPLETALEAAGIALSSQSFKFASDADVASMVKRVLNDDVHIFFINTYVGPGRAIMCEFYRLGLRYPAYAFVTHGWYQDRWWSTEVGEALGAHVPCTQEELQSQLERVLAIQQFPLTFDESANTISGLTVGQFDQEYRKYLNSSYYPNNSFANFSYQIEAYSAFDAMWTLAIGLDKVQQAICANDTLGCNVSDLISLENYRYYNDQIECMLNKTLGETEFNGVSGPVKFDVNGSRIQELFSAFQYQTTTTSTDGQIDTNRVLIGQLNMTDNNSFSYVNNTPAWPNGIPPDGTPISVTNAIHTAVIVIFDIIAALGIIFAICCLVFNIAFRNKKVVKLTSPNLNYVIIIGTLITYSSVFISLLPGLDNISLYLRCIMGYWLSIVGYSMSFSAVLAKMWRVYYIFHNPTTGKRTLKDWHLLLIVFAVTFVTVFLLALGDIVPPIRHKPTLVEDKETPSIINSLNVTVNYYVYRCYDSTEAVAYQALVLAFLFILQIIGIILAFQTRKVKVKILNDAKQVTGIIYVTSVCVVVIIMATFALGSFLNTSSVLYNASILIAMTTFLILIFIPKMISLYRDPEGKNIFTTENPTSQTDNQKKDSLGVNMALSVLGNDPKATIATLQAKIENLEGEIKKYEGMAEEGGLSPNARSSVIPLFFPSSTLPREPSPAKNGQRASSVTFESNKVEESSKNGSVDKLHDVEAGRS